MEIFFEWVELMREARCRFFGNFSAGFGLVFARSINWSCVAVVWFNAVREFQGADASVAVMDRMGTVEMKGIAEVSKKVQELCLPV